MTAWLPKVLELNLGSLKGNISCTKSTLVIFVPYPLPPHIRERYREITMGGHIMKLNNAHFFVPYREISCFGQTSNLKNRKSETIVQAIENIKFVYSQRGFIVTIMNMNGGFEHLREEIALIGIYLKIVSRNEYVPEIEHSNRMVK